MVTRSAGLLLACAAGHDLGRFARETIDWPDFLELAERHGLRPLAYRALERAGLPSPPEVTRALWTASVERGRCNRALSRELSRVAAALEAGGIACLAFKGPVLSLLAHGDVALREFGDLDILVRRRDLHAARSVLADLGYRSEYAIPGHAERALVDAHKHYDIVLRGAAGNLVELHWRTDPDFPVEREDDAWWAACPRIELEGMALRSFAPSELMLVLLLHGAKHHWSNLQWLADVAALARGEPIDWAWIVARARELHCRRRLALGALLMRDLLGVPVPREACGDDPRIASLAAELSREAFEPESPPGAAKLLARNFLLYDRMRERVRNAIEAVFAPTFADWTRWKLPAALAFLYFPLRLARLGGKYSLAALRSPRSRIAATLRTPPPPPHSRG